MLTSPRLACLETAARLALTALPDDGLADLDYGRWSGLDLDSVAAAEPGALQRWISDPGFHEHGGESRAGLALRMAAWLDRLQGAGGHTVAITHAAVIKSLILHVLEAPEAGFWRLDIAPGTATELRHDGRRWAVSTLNCPLPE